MMYGSPKHHNKHHHHQQQQSQQYQSWDSSNGYGAYATMVESMPSQQPEAQQYQYASVTYGNNYEDYVLQDPRSRTHVVAHKRPSAPQHVYSDFVYKVAENVDVEAEEFIKLEHKKFIRLNTQAPG
ncbi:hypothetical protein LWI28_007803 [Acer negundo]|uniref:Uncharacterized protein n=1 Tax=Acer negundo TaxID=4023 RepID=A0AAD5IKX0_ACENE|nr:hypothetical protein LWI28_007803 [Acer negundo]KAK4842774.1 hypothetical protein QYF36_027432 [Acer negundo]